jgi:hypothetical protein
VFIGIGPSSHPGPRALEAAGQVGQGADVPVAVRRRAETVRVEVDRLQPGGQRAGHVIPEAVAGHHDQGLQVRVGEELPEVPGVTICWCCLSPL